MTSHHIFLLVYLLGALLGCSGAQSRNTACATKETCGLEQDPSTHFLQCVGLHSTDTGRDHMHRLKGMLEATMDLYSFMRSSMKGVPLLSLEGALELKPGADPLQNEALVQMWLEVKMKPLLKSITKHFLSCLSTKNFSCSTYHTMVEELSHHYSEMDPVRQKWIYMFFMYPFLSGELVAGCVNPDESSKDWLIKNFGAFRAMARMKDFSSLNLVFSGLEVLHLLTPAQKAELLMSPGVESLDNGTLSLVFHSLLTGGSGPLPTASPGVSHSWTSPGYSPALPSRPAQPSHNSYLPPLQNSFREIMEDFVVAFQPVGSFAHNFVSFTRQRNVSEIRGATLTQFLLNWTLAEVADMYQPKDTSVVPEPPEFDVTNVEDWYQQVVMPLLLRFFPNNEILMHENITLAFHQLFFLDHDMDAGNESSEVQDVCSITLDKAPCGLTNVVENVAHVLHCAARTNLTMTETTVMKLIEELAERLNSLVRELSTANFTELASDFKEIFGEGESPSLTQEHLDDPDFIKLWFRVKLLPLMPDVHPDLLSCLSTKNFSCPVYQTLVAEMGKHMSVIDADPVFSHNIYKHFIYSFLLHHNTSDARCVFPANDSAEWVKTNFGFFSSFASIIDFYRLNPYFSGLDTLHVLSPKQLAEMLLLPLPTPPEKDVVIRRVVNFLVESPEVRKFPEVLHFVVELAEEVNPPCGVYREIFVQLYRNIPSLSPNMEAVVWARIDDLINIAPDECVPANITCPEIQINRTNICRDVDSSDLQSYMNMSMNVACNFTLEQYACAQLENVTASQLAALLRCDLPGNSSHSKMLWKTLLTKHSYVLDPALDMLANMSVGMVSPSAQTILDVIGEMRVSLLTDEQLTDSRVIKLWFSGRLSGFLPAASGRFLHCLSSKNLSCQSFHQILQVFKHQFEDMAFQQQHVVLRDFILRFLKKNQSDPGCQSASNNSVSWLMDNLGPFSKFFSLKEILLLNPSFNPVEALRFLSPNQSAELLVLMHPALPSKEVLINMLFDYLTESPKEKKFTEFLSHLVIVLEKGNLSCSAFKTLFTRLDLAAVEVSLDIASSIMYTKMALSKHIPPGCSIYNGQCDVIMTNETDICHGVNSTELQHHLDSGSMSGRACDFAVEEFACASLSALTPQGLAEMLKCNRSSASSGSTPVWKLLLSKASLVLDEALDLLANTTLDPRSPSVSMVLDALREIRLDIISANLNEPAIIQLWFIHRLRPFLPAVSSSFLSCLSSQDLNCSTYQHLVQVFSHVQPQMSLATQMSVNTHFIKVFLSRNNTADPTCSLHINHTGQWLQKNLGGFSVLLSFQELVELYSNFSAMEALPQLNIRQLAEVSATPGQLTSPAQVSMVMKHVPDQHFSSFFDDFSAAVSGHENTIPSVVRSAMLEVVFDRGNLSHQSVDDSVVLQWLQSRLRPLYSDLSPDHVAPFFRILAGRNCSVEQQGVDNLNLTISTLSDNTQKEIHNHIIQALKGPPPLRCYGDNYNHSFYRFLERSFVGFQFPNLTAFMSLVPHDSMDKIINSMPLSDLGDFLRRPDVVDNETQLCELYNNYIQTPAFLEAESLPDVVKRPTLVCVWPRALSSSSRLEVNAWFDRRLHNYLTFLTKSLISPGVTHNASCVAFQKLVLVLGDYNYTVADFRRQDVFDTVKDYLRAETPRCYNSSHPELNSTAWFVEYIGPFMPFLTLEDLQSFGSEEVLQVFTVNPLNIALLNHSVLPLNLTNYYTQLIYQQDANFNPLLLPLLCRCVVPGQAFTQLSANESQIVLQNLTIVCTDLDPQISAALAANFGDDIDATTITALGNESNSMSVGQIKNISPQDVFLALSTLSSVTGWSEGQAKAIILSLMSSGMMKINSSESLFTLGSLIVGLPSYVFQSVSASQLLIASRDTSIITHMGSASQVIQRTFVTQIISLNTNSETIIQNVPDDFAINIPRVHLQSFSSSSTVITQLNRKKWKRQQVELFFNLIATESATTQLGSPNDLSSSVLQGFSCTSVRLIRRVQIKRLIKACRRKRRNKVKLVETQLTCMYNYIKVESDASNFTLYPPDMLLYYNYALVPQNSCRSYFEQLGDADFFLFSSALRYKRIALFDNAKSCLGITNTSLTEDNVSVLGNMCCVLDGSYIQNSDPSILEKLQSCQDLTEAQAAAVEALLTSGNTKYGEPSSWTGETLTDLGILPLYMPSTFYDHFDKRTKRSFLRYFIRVLRSNGVGRRKKRNLRRAIRASIRKKSKRSTVTECTVGMISSVTISDETFPFDYDEVNQFNCCLQATTVSQNLDAITQKVDEEEYLEIVLSKLREAYNSTIPEDQVQLLSAASRVATVEDINLWNITQIDTLAALMDSSNGEWDPNLAKAIITKYLSVEGNQLGSAELNAIEGPNLCSLDVNVVRLISQQSLKDADALNVSSCTSEKLRELFNIAIVAFASTARSTVSPTSYQLIHPYIGGATTSYIRSLTASNVSMDLSTFTSLNETVVLNLSVSEVGDLLGSNLPELKSYENQTLVQSWIRSQYQSQLDTLGVGLVGGRADPVSSNATTASTTTPTTTPTTTSTTTCNSGNSFHIQADAGLFLLVFLGLLLTSQQRTM